MDLMMKLAFTLATLVTVIAGWAVVNALQSKREVNKSLVAKLESMRLQLGRMEDLGKEVHTGSGHCTNKASQIKRALKLLSAELADAAASGAIASDWAKQQLAFRKALTLQNFEPSGFQSQAFDSDVITSIEVARDSLDRYLMASIRQLNEKICRPDSIRDMLKSIRI